MDRLGRFRGDEADAGLIPDQLGAVGHGAAEARGHVLQRHRPVIVVDIAENAEPGVVRGRSAVRPGKDRLVGIAPQDLGK